MLVRVTQDALSDVSPARLAQLSGVHPTTARRWIRRARCPAWVALLVALLVRGELGGISRAWSGWRIRGDELVSPEGWRFRAGEIRSLPFLHAQISALQARERVALQADWIEQRYVESSAISFSQEHAFSRRA